MEQVENKEVKAESVIMDVTQIMKLLPHRYPFLMVDKIVELDGDQRIVGIKNVTANEPYFMGHFPGRPVMPGVMMLEAMAQTAVILAHSSKEGVEPGKIVFLVGANEFKWKKMVVPGDTLRIEMQQFKKRRPLWIMKGEITVNGKTAASGILSAMESESE